MGLFEPPRRNGGLSGKKTRIGGRASVNTEQPAISKIYLGADHGGFAAKEQLKHALQEGYRVEDMGALELDPNDDYAPYAQAVAEAVARDPQSRGILLCRSGEGMAMAANKVDGIRAALVWNPAVARETRRDNNSNVLTIPSEHISFHVLKEVVDTWLTTPYSGAARHQRRIDQITDMEQQHL